MTALDWTAAACAAMGLFGLGLVIGRLGAL